MYLTYLSCKQNLKFYEDQSISRNKDYKQIGDNIREKFFAPLNKESIDNFLGF